MREVTLNLKDHVYHRLEVIAAKQDARLAEGIEALLEHFVDRYDAAKEAKSEL